MPKSPKAREDRQVHIREDEDEQRFNETVRNLLNTPHKPHKAKRNGVHEALKGAMATGKPPELVPHNKHAKRTATKRQLKDPRCS